MPTEKNAWALVGQPSARTLPILLSELRRRPNPPALNVSVTLRPSAEDALDWLDDD